MEKRETRSDHRTRPSSSLACSRFTFNAHILLPTFRQNDMAMPAGQCPSLGFFKAPLNVRKLLHVCIGLNKRPAWPGSSRVEQGEQRERHHSLWRSYTTLVKRMPMRMSHTYIPYIYIHIYRMSESERDGVSLYIHSYVIRFVYWKLDFQLVCKTEINSGVLNGSQR